MEKAYDRLRWNFIEETFVAAGFNGSFLDVIMACIRSPSMHILVNGFLSDFFNPSRGICQGDPLSQFIFVLCIERLGQEITQLTEEGLWRPMQFVRNGSDLSRGFLQMISFVW